VREVSKVNASVVLCTHNRASRLSRALGSLSDLDLPAGLDWELIVVDNNSTDDTRAIVERVAAESRLPCRYLFEAHPGKSFALNAGVAQALGQVLIFTDDDVTFDPGWLRALLAAFDASDYAGVGGQIVPVWPGPPPRWYSETGPYRLRAAVVRYQFDAAGPVSLPPYGANMAYRREMFERYGLFRTDIGPGPLGVMRGEDSEFGLRVLAGGERVVYVPSAIVYHPVEPERMQLRYFEHFYYGVGRMQVRAFPLPPGTARWLGIPRYLFRALPQHLLQWLTSLNPRARAFHRLSSWEALGSMLEAWKLRRQ
jgi:glycosyltransferase involved in cell wall biosynthesis